MAFKNIEERFNARMKEMYGHGSTKDGGPSGRNDEPFLEWKPNDKDRRETANDSRSLPIGSTKRDVKRLSKFLVSDRGIKFLTKEQLLQSGNTFTETRILNPLFVIGNAVPFVHLSRSLSSPRDFEVQGQIQYKSPASDAKVGSAGRLQKATADKVIGDVTRKGGKSGLMSLISPTKLLGGLASTFSVGKRGSLGINERPELNVNGEYYSVMLWKGFIKLPKEPSALQSLQSNLRSGNLSGAISSTKKIISNFLGGIKPVTPKPLPIRTSDERGSTTSDIDLAGRRYFITGPNDMEGYLLKQLPPVPKAYDIDGSAFLPPLEYKSQIKVTGFDQRISQQNKDASTAKANEVKTKKTGLSGLFSGIKDSFIQGLKQTVIQAVNNTPGTLPKSQRSPAPEGSIIEEDVLRFPDLSIKARYNEDRMQELRDALQLQKDRSFTYYDEIKVHSDIGYSYGLPTPGQDVKVNPRSHIKHTNAGYLRDNLNLPAYFDESPSATRMSAETALKIKSLGKDLIDVYFFDFVNKRSIPFRAYVSNISENVSPEMSDTRYIGRIERNVVYVGVSRELSFNLKIHAMHDEEMDGIWEKINYLTGLCYPSNYTNGFMVPPFVKLTIGSVYFEQPGYFKSLSHKIEDGISWEIEEGRQAPHGISVDVSFSVIEKRQMKTTSTFYPFLPRF